MTSRESTLRRMVAGVGAVALGLAGALAMTTNASAAPGPGQDGAPDTGSLIIHKLLGTEGQPGDGQQQEVSGTALPGAGFTIWKVGIPATGGCDFFALDETGDWELLPPTGVAAPSSPDAVQAAGFCLAEVADGVTDANGELTFSGLDLGFYYVQETLTPSGITSPSAPFYVAIPMPLKNDGWLYDVHVYPKNLKADEPVKTINDTDSQTGLVVGSTVTWTITQNVPPLNAGDSYVSASVWDTIPVGLSSPTTVSVTVGDTTLTEGTGYSMSIDAEIGKVTWTLEADGIAALAAGKVITVKFTTVVEAVTESGEIINSDYGSEFNGGTTPGDPDPRTYWGELRIYKHDDSTPTNLPLAGAVFEVYEATAPTCPADVPATAPIATGVTDATGVVQWETMSPADVLGLFVANSSDGPLANPAKSYCVYETVVPSGYVDAKYSALVTITPGALAEDAYNLTVRNVMREGPQLPLTGGSGTVGLMAAGAIVAGAGIGVMLNARRRRTMAA